VRITTFSSRLIYSCLGIAFGGLEAHAEGTPEFFRPLDRAGITGLWEGVLPVEQQLVQMRYDSDDEAFLTLVSSLDTKQFVRVYVLKSSSVQNGYVTLRFVGHNPAEPGITIDGRGYATALAGGDFIQATIASDSEQNVRKPLQIVLHRGPWTRQLEHLSHVAEGAIQQQTEAVALEAGRIYNIPVYDQASMRGQWPDRAPSADETRKALRAVELFLRKEGDVSGTAAEMISCILQNKQFYRVQFIGVRDGAKRTMLCNFFLDDGDAAGELRFPNWKKEQIRCKAKNCDCWHIEYDLERDQCSHFSTGQRSN